MMVRDSRGRRVAPRRVHYTFRDTAVASSSSALANLRPAVLARSFDSVSKQQIGTLTVM